MFEKIFGKKEEVEKNDSLEIFVNNLILEFGYKMSKLSPLGEDSEKVLRFQPIIPFDEQGRAPTQEELETFQRHLVEALKYSDIEALVTIENMSASRNSHIKMELVTNNGDIDENDIGS